MAATPFTGTLVYRTMGGQTYTKTVSFDDVATNLATWDDLGGASVYTIPTKDGHWEIVDLILSAAGVDTDQLRLVVDGADTQVTFRDALLADTTTSRDSRVPQGAYFIGGGSNFQIKQLA